MVNVKEIEGKDFNIKRSAEEDRILSFKDHVCIGCGLCEATCPVEAIALDEVAPIERKYTETYFSGHEKIAQPEISRELMIIEQGEGHGSRLSCQSNGSDVPSLVQELVFQVEKVINRLLQHHNTTDRNIRKLEPDFKQLVRVDA